MGERSAPGVWRGVGLAMLLLLSVQIIDKVDPPFRQGFLRDVIASLAQRPGDVFGYPRKI